MMFELPPLFGVSPLFSLPPLFAAGQDRRNGTIDLTSIAVAYLAARAERPLWPGVR